MADYLLPPAERHRVASAKQQVILHVQAKRAECTDRHGEALKARFGNFSQLFSIAFFRSPLGLATEPGFKLSSQRRPGIASEGRVAAQGA
jgi:hypothetical protein